MYLCSDGHDEIVSEGFNCPLCAANNQIENLEGSVEELNGKIGSLEEERDTLQSEINNELGRE